MIDELMFLNGELGIWLWCYRFSDIFYDLDQYYYDYFLFGFCFKQ